MSDIVEAAHQGRIVPMIFRDDPAARQGGALVADGTEPTVTKLGFTATVNVNGKDVDIKADNILEIAAKGIEFDLIPPGGPPLELGNLQGLIEWFAKEMKFDPPVWENLPTKLQDITKVTADLHKLYVKANKDAVQFDIIVELKFDWQLVGGLVLKSFTFQLYRGQAANPTPTPPPDNG